MKKLILKIKRGIKKPPGVIIRRIISEIRAETERFLSPYRASHFTKLTLQKKTEVTSVDELWSTLGDSPFTFIPSGQDCENFRSLYPEDIEQIIFKAKEAINHRVNLLGSGNILLGDKIDWHKDYKTGYTWSNKYFRSIDYNNPDQPSDVKFPWELSRMQWLIPAGQAYLITEDEKYAFAVRDILSDWIDSNPYAHSVNWACTMEVALRILSWTWFFSVFHKSKAWQDDKFRFKFLKALYLHGDFTARHLERSDINGNHYTADAAGLVFAGLFFRKGKEPKQWQSVGWNILCDEITRQVFSDGVDFEGSIPYHRLVSELFLLPALYRLKNGRPIPEYYKDRLINMARFTVSYSRQDGSVPLWGDADDGRALPFGNQNINDHRYLIGIVGMAWDVQDLKQFASGSLSEAFWLLGPGAADTLNPTDRTIQFPTSRAFPEGGFYIMQNERDHLFIDCGPLGLGGRGGHGHNDLLSFEAVLDDVHLISDCGAYVYTANFQERNRFRSTAYHNTPQVDGEEINRFIRPDYLWNLHNDADFKVRDIHFSTDLDRLVMSHSGYERLQEPVRLVRTIELQHESHCLRIEDQFEGKGQHYIETRLHLAPGVSVSSSQESSLELQANGRSFLLNWSSNKYWKLHIEPTRISPSYGVIQPSIVLRWDRLGNMQPLEIIFQPK